MVTFFNFLEMDKCKKLESIVGTLLQKGKGILCMDDSAGPLWDRLTVFGMRNTLENRRKFRQLIISSEYERSLNDNISGLLMNPEAFHQFCDSNVAFTGYLKRRGIAVGINLANEIPTTGSNKSPTGLDYLRHCCDSFNSNYCQFAKWSCTYRISSNEPSTQCLVNNANQLAYFAAVVQRSDLLPLLCVDVLMDGGHSINDCEVVTHKVLANLAKALIDYHVFLEGCLLEMNMVTSGTKWEGTESTENNYNVALATLRTLLCTVPPAIPGILFSSGSQKTRTFINNLNQINILKGKSPWVFSFCLSTNFYGPILQIWEGTKENTLKAQIELLNRLEVLGQASIGRYVENSSTSKESHPKTREKIIIIYKH